jgi:hypothetical protein
MVCVKRWKKGRCMEEKKHEVLGESEVLQHLVWFRERCNVMKGYVMVKHGVV